jgi:plastocyanin
MRSPISAFAAAILAAMTYPAFAHDMDHGAMANAAPAAAQTAAIEANTVAIDNFAFGPNSLTVAAGTTVTWINRDDEPHTVVNAGNPRLFKSSALDTGNKFSFTFDKPGTYRYFCSLHPHMTGVIVVQ